jgi:hypothetical protein
MDAFKRMMSSLDPIMKIFEKALEGIANGVAKVADWIGRMIGKVTERFTQAKEEAEGLGDAVAEGIEEATPVAVQAAEKMGEQMAEAIENKLMEIDWGKVEAAQDKRIAAEKKAREAYAKEQAELDAMLEEEWESTNESIDAYFEDIKKKEDESKRRTEELAQARIDSMFAMADATSSVLGSLASMYESDEKNAEKNAKKIKALRIAEATINTISGAIGAFMQASASMPPPFGAIVGAVQAAAITAAGIAQIANIKKTNVSANGTSSQSVTAPSASVAAPNVETSLTTTRNVTTASEEERLNRMASSQKVYILQSDIEAAGEQSKAQVAESSF